MQIRMLHFPKNVMLQISVLYEDMEYTKILQSTLKFLKDDVSAFYTTLIKDRYATVMVYILTLCGTHHTRYG